MDHNNDILLAISPPTQLTVRRSVQRQRGIKLKGMKTTVAFRHSYTDGRQTGSEPFTSSECQRVQRKCLRLTWACGARSNPSKEGMRIMADYALPVSGTLKREKRCGVGRPQFAELRDPTPFAAPSWIIICLALLVLVPPASTQSSFAFLQPLPTPVQCQTYAFAWTGGTPTYTLSISLLRLHYIHWLYHYHVLNQDVFHYDYFHYDFLHYDLFYHYDLFHHSLEADRSTYDNSINYLNAYERTHIHQFELHVFGASFYLAITVF
ncbi:hypothetical protein GSI_08589 [Ganoderma sinense ZZ0214-1]|uniref:Uncharacterized protein n=1 Tax=Ganoderma sinense ZZ0214-1 TaxID=1077348 RepID=A0A2G8S4Q2_9APHY|nr:hypothetical protein GSI_08589 [Ganoderma sinense ZZ0214-1]